MIVSALAGLFFWVYMTILASEVGGFLNYLFDDAGTILIVIGVVGIIACLVTALGGVMAIMKKKWALALIGSILGILFCGWFYCLGTLCSIAAMILIIVGKKHFK